MEMFKSLARALEPAPLPVRFAVVGAMLAGATGAIVGLVIGLNANPPTAPFAVLEIGLPATILGGVVGLLAGVITAVVLGAVSQIRRVKASSRSD